MNKLFEKLYRLLRNCSEAIQRHLINYRQHRQWERDREERGYKRLTCRLHDTEYEAIKDYLNQKFDTRRPMRVHIKGER